ncbi:hypothetical protein LF1_53860 [Rubripirellula obstinata]|uniref:DUF2892 domain-containing protein n=1 Tax=Rubripirellula obstinata TaxID=406547 RepID=A0A5B1C822_9BACT|nr:hypothetical protein LF1_53860 [Rubripirellula obstinata]
MKTVASAVIVLSASVLFVAASLTNNFSCYAIYTLGFVLGLTGVTDYCRSWKTTNDEGHPDRN